MRLKTKLVYGVGINDADYTVQPMVNGKQEWCPFYNRWKHMLTRCYSKKYKDKHPTYQDCKVCHDWLKFSNFKSWMETQDWEGNELDKDLLVDDNKEYTPSSCIFLPHNVNKFMTDRVSKRGDYPLGVNLNIDGVRYNATCKDLSGKTLNLRTHSTPEEAHNAYLIKKAELAIELASQQTDKRVADALIKRYVKE